MLKKRVRSTFSKRKLLILVFASGITVISSSASLAGPAPRPTVDFNNNSQLTVHSQTSQQMAHVNAQHQITDDQMIIGGQVVIRSTSKLDALSMLEAQDQRSLALKSMFDAIQMEPEAPIQEVHNQFEAAMAFERIILDLPVDHQWRKDLSAAKRANIDWQLKQHQINPPQLFQETAMNFEQELTIGKLLLRRVVVDPKRGGKASFVPSADELQSAGKKLKKTEAVAKPGQHPANTSSMVPGEANRASLKKLKDKQTSGSLNAKLSKARSRIEKMQNRDRVRYYAKWGIGSLVLLTIIYNGISAEQGTWNPAHWEFFNPADADEVDAAQ